MTTSTNGKFRTRRHKFTQVSNTALTDKTLSLKAKGLYALINSYITIPDFILYKQTLVNSCKEGRDSFNAAWKELKDSGYLIQERVLINGKFSYEYELLDEPEGQGSKKEKKEQVDSTGDGKPVTDSDDGKSVYGKSVDGSSTLGKPVDIINTNENNTEQNNTNSFIPSITLGYLVQDLNELREGKNDIEHIDSVLEKVYSNPELHDFKKELESAVYRRKDLEGYTFNDFVIYAAFKTNFKRAFTIADDNEQRAYNYAYEWLLSYASLMSQAGNTIKIGSNTYKLADLRERLIQVNEFTLTSLIDKIKAVSSQQEIKNFGSYMQKMWIDACFDSGDLQFSNAPMGGYSNN